MSGALSLAPHMWFLALELWAVTSGTGGITVVIAIILFNSHKRSQGIFLRPKSYHKCLTKTRLSKFSVNTLSWVKK